MSIAAHQLECVESKACAILAFFAFGPDRHIATIFGRVEWQCENNFWIFL